LPDFKMKKWCIGAAAVTDFRNHLPLLHFIAFCHQIHAVMSIDGHQYVRVPNHNHVAVTFEPVIRNNDRTISRSNNFLTYWRTNIDTLIVPPV